MPHLQNAVVPPRVYSFLKSTDFASVLRWMAYGCEKPWRLHLPFGPVEKSFPEIRMHIGLRCRGKPSPEGLALLSQVEDQRVAMF